MNPQGPQTSPRPNQPPCRPNMVHITIPGHQPNPSPTQPGIPPATVVRMVSQK